MKREIILIIETRQVATKIYTLDIPNNDLRKYKITAGRGVIAAVLAIIKNKKVTRLVIINGIGSRFSSLRAGVVLANALFFSTKLPLHQLILPLTCNLEKNFEKVLPLLKKALTKKPSLQKPHYAFEPNITLAKKS